VRFDQRRFFSTLFLKSSKANGRFARSRRSLVGQTDAAALEREKVAALVAAQKY
jgi:hypothetical protein